MIDKSSILERVGSIDLRKLSINAREAFVLSQIDGQLSLEELADLVGVELGAAKEMALKLVDVGAASIKGAPKRRTSSKSVKMPRVSKAPPKMSSRPPRMSSPPKLSSRPPKPATEVCELDAEVQKAIRELDARVLLTDHYGRLGLERGADRKTVKRAYFALAGKFHPDRFFGKKLGPLKPIVDRVFRLVTEAHDTLVDADRRTKYDATLPHLSKPPRAASVRPSKPPRAPAKSETPPARTSRAPRAPSRKMKRVSMGASAAEAATAIPIIVPPPPAMPNPIPQQSQTLTADRIKSLLAGTREVRSKERADLLVKAAEEAMAKGDVIGASNNYRLALEHRDDPYLRAKLEDVDRLAKSVRFDRHLNRAKNAEKERQWADAAEHFERAFECKRDAAVAERVAASLHLAMTDPPKALQFAEQAVAMRGGNADYRITLAEILISAQKVDLAKEHIEKALELDPKEARAKELAKLIAKKK